MTTSKTALALDLRAVHRNLYTAPWNAPQIVEVPELLALAASGSGGPASEAWIGAVQSLFTLAYGLRKQMKTLDPPVNARVMPLEGIWSGPDDRAFANIQPGELRWTLLIVVPDTITWDDLNACRAEAAGKKPHLPLGNVRLESLSGGPAVQILHRGPYSEEGPVLERLRAFASERGWRPERFHQEIYLNDSSRTAPEKLRTILRLPLIAPTDAVQGG